jgi:hypothetical protein
MGGAPLLRDSGTRSDGAVMNIHQLNPEGRKVAQWCSAPEGKLVIVARPRAKSGAGDALLPSHGGFSGKPDRDRLDAIRRGRLSMRRRDFIAGFGSVVVWPVVTRAQQPVVPVIGYLNLGSSMSGDIAIVPLRKGLSEMGYAEGRNLAIEFRWAKNDFKALPELAADLVHRRVAVIVAIGTAAPRAASGLDAVSGVADGFDRRPSQTTIRPSQTTIMCLRVASSAHASLFQCGAFPNTVDCHLMRT